MQTDQKANYLQDSKITGAEKSGLIQGLMRFSCALSPGISCAPPAIAPGNGTGLQAWALTPAETERVRFRFFRCIGSAGLRRAKRGCKKRQGAGVVQFILKQGGMPLGGEVGGGTGIYGCSCACG